MNNTHSFQERYDAVWKKYFTPMDYGLYDPEEVHVVVDEWSALVKDLLKEIKRLERDAR